MLNLYLLAHQKKTLQFLFLLQQLNESPKTSRCRRWGIGYHPFQSCLPLPILSISPSQNRSMRLRGNLKSWNDERGFGFIEPAQGGHDIFVHITAFPPSSNRPKIGQALTFEIEAGPNGKQRARSVQYRIPSVHPRRTERSSLQHGLFHSFWQSRHSLQSGCLWQAGGRSTLWLLLYISGSVY